MNRRNVLGGLGGLAVGGLAGCSACGDCFSPFRALRVAVRPVGWGSRLTGTADGAGSTTGPDASREAWSIEVRITNRMYKVDRGPFRDVSVVAYDRRGERLAAVPVGEISAGNGFTRETRDGGCCGGTFVTYERKWIDLEPDGFPRYVAPSIGDSRCDPRRDRIAHVRMTETGTFDSTWRDCDEPLPFRETDATSSDGS